jgi:hypothetical protein
MKRSFETPVFARRAQTFAALLLAMLSAHVAANDFALSPAGMFPSFHWSVSIDGGTAQANPPLLLIRGQTYTFHVTGLVGVHSFYINTINTTLHTDEYSGGGLSANGVTVDTTAGSPITFTVPQDAPDTLFYNCGVHSSMAGTITIDGIFANGFESQ